MYNWDRRRRKMGRCDLKPFSFVHVADLHVGYEQYNLAARTEDFDRAFREVVEKTIKLKPEFMIIAGDLFHHARPTNTTLEKAISNFRRLKEAGIPVLAVDGSHDAAPNMITGTILNPLDSAGLIYYLPRHEGACWANENCYVYGIPNYRTRERTEQQLPAFYEMKKPEPRRDTFNIFVFHMTLEIPEIIKGHPKFVAEAPPELIPDGFNYYAGGHIHTPWQFPFKRAMLVYSGSTETVNYEDADVEKGFYHVKVSPSGETEIDRMRLQSPRRFKILDKDYTGLAPSKITELAAQLVKEADEPGVVLVPVLRGTLPLESSRREIDLSRIRNAAEKALIVHPMPLMKEVGIPEETIRSIFEGEMRDLKTKSFDYFVQFFSQRYIEAVAQKNAHLALDMIQFLVEENEEKVRELLEAFLNADQDHTA
jgi:DNA repair exonuclease SbcCD nuclease subunit